MFLYSRQVYGSTSEVWKAGTPEFRELRSGSAYWMFDPISSATHRTSLCGMKLVLAAMIVIGLLAAGAALALKRRRRSLVGV